MWPKCSTNSAGRGDRFTALICLREEPVASAAAEANEEVAAVEDWLREG